MTREKTDVQRDDKCLKRNTHASTERDKWAKNTHRLEGKKFPAATRLIAVIMKSQNQKNTESQNS